MVEAVPKEVIIGIDLGTTNSAVAFWAAQGEDGYGRAEIIQNQDGDRTTPSMISIKKKDACVLVGRPAMKLVI